MKPTRKINVTGNPNWRYTQPEKTDVAATIARWRKDYAEAWDAAHEENARMESQRAKIPTIGKRASK